MGHVDDVGAALDALGDTPTGDEARAITGDYDPADTLAAIWPTVKAGGGGGGGGAVSVASVTLTNAQIKALPSTPVTLVAAAGAGTIVVPIHATLRLDWAADYTNIDAEAQIIVGHAALGGFLAMLMESTYGDVSSTLAFGESSIATLGPIDYAPAAFGSPARGSAGVEDSEAENTPVSVRMLNDLGDLTGGDAANVLKVTVLYYVVTF